MLFIAALVARRDTSRPARSQTTRPPAVALLTPTIMLLLGSVASTRIDASSATSPEPKTVPVSAYGLTVPEKVIREVRLDRRSRRSQEKTAFFRGRGW